MKAPPAKSPAERMKHTAGAAARGGGDAPPSLGLVPSAAPPPPSSSPSDSLPRFAAIAAHNTTPPLFLLLLPRYRLAFCLRSPGVPVFIRELQLRTGFRTLSSGSHLSEPSGGPGQIYEPNQAGE